jgi:phospholipase C
VSPLTRRQLLLGTAAGAAGAAVSRAIASPGPVILPTSIPNPNHCPIEHIVVVVMENRSFDHYLGWMANEPKFGSVAGEQAGLSYPDDTGVMHATHRLTERQGCGFNDPDHSYNGGRTQLNCGAVDGFRKGDNDDFALGYYLREDLPFYGGSQSKPGLVDVATTFDNWFCSILSQTYPNRYYTHAARTDRLDNTMASTTLPTIWDSLEAAGVPAAYYFSDLPFLALWGEKYIPISRHMETFFAQAASGTLPQFSYLDPFFLGEDQGGSNDDHPHADIWRGQAFLSQVAQAVVNSPLWPKTALIVTYDEWGGFFDHVVPPRFPDDTDFSECTPYSGSGDFDHGQAGFRVPSFVLSPFARRGAVNSTLFEHTAMLKLVEWRFGLQPLSLRDKKSNNIADVLNFDPAAADLSIPDLPIVADPGPHICGSPGVGMAAEDPFWVELRDHVHRTAWRHIV